MTGSINPELPGAGEDREVSDSRVKGSLITLRDAQNALLNSENKVPRAALAPSFVQTKRVETPELAAGQSKEVTITWPSSFTDTAYTVSLSCQSEGVATGVTVRQFKSKLAASIIVVVKNDSEGGLKGTINAVAIHD